MVTVASFAAGLDRLCAMADRAAASRAGAGVPRRSAFQRAELFARFRPHAGAARTGLCPADRGQRRNRQGSEDLRPQRLPDRPLHAASPPISMRPTAGWRCGAPAGAALFTAIGTIGYYMAYAYIVVADAGRRVLRRRSDLPCGIVPAPAHASRRAAGGLFHHGGPGALSQRSVLLLRGQAGNPVAGESAALSQADPRGLRVRGCRLHLSRRRAMGGAPPQLHAARPARCWRWSARTAPARRRW